MLITGAAGGIGSAAVAELRKHGATVVGLDLQGSDIDCDVRDQASVDRAVAEAIERLGGLDVLINNAGLGTPQSAGEPPDEDALAVLDVNLIGPWRVTAAALPALREARGRVINVASGLAHMTVPFATAYTLSKRGIVAYSDVLRLEEGDRITVTTVYPGYIRTKIHERSTRPACRSRAPCPSSASKTPPARSPAPRSAAPCATWRRPARARSATHCFGSRPRRAVDLFTRAQMRRLARRGHFAERRPRRRVRG